MAGGILGPSGSQMSSPLCAESVARAETPFCGLIFFPLSLTFHLYESITVLITAETKLIIASWNIVQPWNVATGLWELAPNSAQSDFLEVFTCRTLSWMFIIFCFIVSGSPHVFEVSEIFNHLAGPYTPQALLPQRGHLAKRKESELPSWLGR